MATKNLVEETLIQIQNLEEAINENAKEILASTMKEEISELVKESMKDETNEVSEEMTEADEDDEFEMSDDEDSDDEDSEEELGMDMDSDDEMDMDSDDEMDMDSDDEMSMSTDDVMDLRDFDDESVYKIFSKMSSSDEVTVTKDGDYLHVTDEPKDAEYLIQTESEEDELEESWETEMEESEEDELEEVIYELEMEESDEEEFEYEMAESEEDDDEEFEFEMEEMGGKTGGTPITDGPIQEKYENNKGKKTIKPKVGSGAKTGSASKFSYKKSKGGFKETMKKANPTKGTGKPKFEFKEGEMDLSKVTKKEMGAMGAKKSETKEAARTYGMGWRKDALPKGARAGSESVREEVETLRTKNEEYRKALNLFRDKLNEVAIFNSNLAYATRLFTEHSTSKQEKINILRRFDSAETLKESKALYKTIKDELSINNVSPITESIEKVIEREPVQSGSAINLIESKTYENPQFLRMKDIMSKIAK